MIPRRIKNATLPMQAPAGVTNCVQLWVRREVERGDDYNSVTFTSAWEPTPEELKIINEGGSVVVTIIGGQPMMRITAEAQE